MSLDGETTIPAEVRAFLRDQLDSFEKLEALLLLAAHPGEGWSAFAVGDKLGMPSSLAAVTLEELRELGLVGLAADGRYLFEPGPGTAVVPRLAAIYEQDRVGVVMFLNTAAMSRIRGSAARAFADAFRVRPPAKGGKGGSDG